jgi:dTDP-4-amino-4,6-dideoxygalactose transaminase
MTNEEIKSLHQVTVKFEQEVAEFCGAPYFVSTNSCTNALMITLSLIGATPRITLPTNTFIGVYWAAYFNNIEVDFEDIKWDTHYRLLPTSVIDSARMFHKNCYIADSLQCVSFGYKKILNIGSGGGILLDNLTTYNDLVKARNSGKNISKNSLTDMTYSVPGLNMVLHPELSKIGIVKLTHIKSLPPQKLPKENYGDLSKQILSANLRNS